MDLEEVFSRLPRTFVLRNVLEYSFKSLTFEFFGEMFPLEFQKSVDQKDSPNYFEEI